MDWWLILFVNSTTIGMQNVYFHFRLFNPICGQIYRLWIHEWKIAWINRKASWLRAWARGKIVWYVRFEHNANKTVIKNHAKTPLASFVNNLPEIRHTYTPMSRKTFWQSEHIGNALTWLSFQVSLTEHMLGILKLPCKQKAKDIKDITNERWLATCWRYSVAFSNHLCCIMDHQDAHRTHSSWDVLIQNASYISALLN